MDIEVCMIIINGKRFFFNVENVKRVRCCFYSAQTNKCIWRFLVLLCTFSKPAFYCQPGKVNNIYIEVSYNYLLWQTTIE